MLLPLPISYTFLKTIILLNIHYSISLFYIFKLSSKLPYKDNKKYRNTRIIRKHSIDQISFKCDHNLVFVMECKFPSLSTVATLTLNLILLLAISRKHPNMFKYKIHLCFSLI